MKSEEYGKHSESLVTNTAANPNSNIYKEYHKTIKNFDNEAVYIYSFKENKMLYAYGWEDVLGYKDNEFTLHILMKSSSKRHLAFSNELNDKALKFLSVKTKNLEEYSFTIEVEKIHKNGSIVPLFSRIAVYKANNGQVEEIIGISQVIPSLKFGNVMQYAAYGPEKSDFEETLSEELLDYHAISRKEKEALKLASEGLAFKEIANLLNVSQSAIEKRILPLYKRFDVRSLPHLISFAYKNHIL